MSRERVAQAIENLKDAIDEGEHTCTVAIEPLGDMTEVAFYLDGDDEDPAATLTVVPPG